MKKSQLLRQALPFLKCPENAGIQTARYTFICVAVYNCARFLSGKSGTADALQTSADIGRLIRKRLGAENNLSNWLAKQGLRPKCNTVREQVELVGKIQSYRLAWMRELIREFEEKGE